MMTTASLYTFLSKPSVVLNAFRGLGARRASHRDVLVDIELPMGVFAVGIPMLGLLTAYLAHLFFGVAYWMGLIAIPLVFVFTLIAVNSTGLTSITPTGALGKLTQLSFSVIAPGNITTNVMTASITGEVAGNASNLLMDIKPGYMLGGKPRHQAVGHVLGIFSGSLLSVPAFYALFQGDVSRLATEALPMPSAQVWRAVAELLTRGLSFLHDSAKISILVGALLGIAIEVANQKRKGQFFLSGVGVGLAFVLPFSDSLAMAAGAVAFWFVRRKATNAESRAFRVFVANQETVCAGAIAGGALVGLLLILLEAAG